MDIFYLAEIQLQVREGISVDNPNYLDLLLDRIKKIRRFYDYQARGREISKGKK